MGAIYVQKKMRYDRSRPNRIRFFTEIVPLTPYADEVGALCAAIEGEANKVFWGPALF